MTFIASAVVAGAQAVQNSEDQGRVGIFGWLANLGATAILATQEDVDAGKAFAVGDPILLSTLEIDPPVSKLAFNNVNQPLPTANDTITLREYEGAPIPQQDAEFNFINLTDRINQLIDSTAASDTAIVDAINSINTAIEDVSTSVSQNTANLNNVLQEEIPVFTYNAATKTLTISSEAKLGTPQNVRVSTPDVEPWNNFKADWTPVENASEIQGYIAEVDIFEEGKTLFENPVVTLTPDQRPVYPNALSADTTYAFRVKTRGHGGFYESNWSQIVFHTTAPNP